MCTIPPAPPPPPSGAYISKNSSPERSVSNNNNPSFGNLSGICEWASSDPELREVCIKNNICLNQSPFQYSYKRFESIMQVGPTCGLVALAMLLKGEVSPEELLNITKTAGYSSNGEMFSCLDMAHLAQKAISLSELGNIKVRVQKGGLNTDDTVKELLNGAALLVAYDADYNHSPCLRKGHTAHWALICGVIVLDEPLDNDNSNSNNIYILARHGKSRYLAAWPLQQLDRSNKNLQEFSPKKQEDGLLYILPEGGMGGDKGLRDQFLIFTGL